MSRLFVAIDPPDAVRKELGGLRAALNGARWVDTPQLHVTLRFIGDGETESVGNALALVRFSAFSISFAGVGRFPPRRSPRVLWAGIEPEESLRTLQTKVEAALRGAGIAPDEKPFSPHLTLTRLGDGASPREVEEWLDERKRFRSASFRIAQFFLYSSRLGPGGAQHTRERSYDPGGATN